MTNASWRRIRLVAICGKKMFYYTISTPSPFDVCGCVVQGRIDT